ncbi:DNA topoisomerase IV [Lutimonas zeaxanthinifaciens]|uniref:DNA topoisomerase IV n=1 Tax=Lutimonas zeaxanthinifaciens TaxID=3060215 RepID=UPI00265D305D|nr:DNA topoisomerase IV [Lutimonas sp. YSD2104]WKK64809.1 DNA topoisomerase IV [Lutimonas sp. YSD2104]
MRNTFLLLVLCFFISCNQGKRLRVDDLKSGRFKTVLEDEETESFATRNDSIQIEEYQKLKDTFYIEWIDQFEYVLIKTNPKTLLDSTPFHVKITSIKKDGYDFNAYYKGSNFKQKGRAYKIDVE